jgi:hypothetical protein
MHQFYSTTYPGRDPTPLETCHFSVTIEGYTIMIWMHWREVHPENGEIYFRMEIVHRAFLDVLTDMLEFRKILHNYVDYAMGERLRSIKEALPVFWSNLQKNKGGASKSQSVATTSVSELPPDLRRSMPVFPSSSAGESASGDVVPTKKTKRKRTA